MFDKISFKKKFYFSIIAFILVLMALYKKNFRHIFEMIPLTRTELTLTDTNHEYLIESLKDDINNLERVIGSTTLKPEQIQQHILEFIAKRNVQVIEMNPIHSVEKNGFNVYTCEVNVTGNYEQLIKLVYKVETEFKISKLINSTFYVKMNYSTQQKELYLKLLFQNYEKLP